MIGYGFNKHTGAVIYNIFHSYILPIGVVFAGMLLLTWIAHIGIDRMIGYGLKYTSEYKDTHFQKV